MIKITSILSLLLFVSTFGNNQNVVSAIDADTRDLARNGSIWIPNCNKPKHKSRPQCMCRYPQNWEDEICQGTNWWGKPAILDNVMKSSRIVGGELAPSDAYPWFARLVTRTGSWWGCGGMLVAPDYVLTAAHCVTAGDASTLAVQIGAVCPEQSGNCGQPLQQINAVSVTQHPNYNSGTTNNDYALIKLASRANADPVPMDQGQYVDNYPSDKRNLYAIGFGSLSSGGSVSSELMHVELAYVTRSACNAGGAYNGAITNYMMCAADPGQDSCQGDSGGPLYDADNNVLVGVVSWGYGCALPEYPGVYAQVSARWSWLQTNICADHSSPKPDFCTGSPTKVPTPSPPTPSPTTSCSSNELSVKVSVTTDSWPGEISWTMQSPGNTISSDPFIDALTTYETDLCLDPSSCHTFTINDTYGDGILSEGDFSVTVDGSVVLSNQSGGWTSLSAEIGQCSTPNPPTAAPTASPKTSSPTKAPSKSPTATPPTATTPCGQSWKKRFQIDLTTDDFGSETSFKVFRRRNNGQFTRLVYSRSDFASNTDYTFDRCFPKSKCYKFVVYDSHGDGMCCSHGEGSFQGYWNGNPIPNVSDVFNSGTESYSEQFGNC